MFTRGMEFDLGEDVNALRAMVHDWAQDRVAPLAAETMVQLVAKLAMSSRAGT